MLDFLKGKPDTAGTPPLVLANTLSGKTEEFAPLKPPEVRMYNCGPTVYDTQHIGNLRAYVFTDTLRRVLEYNGYTVQQVMNITDVGHLTSDADEGEDKMTAGLKREGMAVTLANMQKLGERYTDVFKEDLKQLNIKPPHTFSRASEHIPEQIALLETLEEKGYTYSTSDGVYFDTSRFPDYGKLGDIDIEALKEGARTDVNKEKRNPADFALWKLDEKLGWDSPWGKGFPGWHLECSAMSMKYLGKSFDIHTGGIDHIGVHHNNEIAQSEAATGKPFARFWLHNAFLLIEGRKIAKSVGNTVYLYQIADRGYSPLAFRYWLLSAHYRSPMNFTWEALEAAHTALRRLLSHFVEELGTETGTVNAAAQERFHAAINDDLNTPEAIAVLWEVVKSTDISKADKRATLLDFNDVLGLGLSRADKNMLDIIAGKQKRLSIDEVPDEIQKLAEKRETARTEQDFETADKLRDELAEAGYTIEDTPEGPKFVHTEDRTGQS